MHNTIRDSKTGKTVGEYVLKIYTTFEDAAHFLRSEEPEKVQLFNNEHLYPIGCLVSLNIDDKYQGKGYGSKALEEIYDECYACKNLILVADLEHDQQEGFDLFKWYEREGFKTIIQLRWGPLMLKKLR